MSEQSSRPSSPPSAPLSSIPLSNSEIEEVKIPNLAPPPLPSGKRPGSSSDLSAARGANGGMAARAGSSPALRPGSSPALRPGSSPALRPGSSPALRPGSSHELRAAPPLRLASSPDLGSASARRPGSSPAIAPPSNQAARSKHPDNEDDPASVFDVDTHAPRDHDIDVETNFAENERPEPSGLVDLQSVLSQFEDPAPKRVDDDMVNLSGGLFGGGGGSGQVALVAPDLSSLSSVTGSPAKPAAAAKPAKKAAQPASTAKASAEPSPAVPLLAPVMTLEQAAQKKSIRPTAAAQKEKAPSRAGRIAVWVVGAAAGIAAMYGVFQFAAKNPPEKPQAAATQVEAKPEEEPLGAPRHRDSSESPEQTEPAKPQAPKAPSTTAAGAQARSEQPASAQAAAGAQAAGPAGPAAAGLAAAGPTASDTKGAAEPEEPKAPEEPAPAAGMSKQEALAAALAAAPTAANVQGPARTTASSGQFDATAARGAMSAAAGRAGGCKKEGDPSGTARVSVTFASSGRVTSALVTGPPFAGTPTGGCIASAFRSASVPSFSGSPVTVSKTITIR